MKPREEEEVGENEPHIRSTAQLNDPREYGRYRGKVIAIIDGEVRASDDTWVGCLRAVSKMGIADDAATFMQVPPAHFVA